MPPAPVLVPAARLPCTYRVDQRSHHRERQEFVLSRFLVPALSRWYPRPQEMAW